MTPLYSYYNPMPDNPCSMSNNISNTTAFVTQSSSEGSEKRDRGKGSKNESNSHRSAFIDNHHQDDQSPRKRGRFSSTKNNNNSSSNIHSKSSRRDNDEEVGSVDRLVTFTPNQSQSQSNLTDGLDPLVDSNRNSNTTNNIININFNNDNSNKNSKTVINTPQQHQKSIPTISDNFNCQLKTPTKKCNGINENVNNYTAASSPPPSPKRVKTSIPLSPVKTCGRSNNTVTSHTFQSCGGILFGGLDTVSPLSKRRFSFPTSSNNSLYQDYVINAGQQESLDKFHSLAPGVPLHDIKMCRVMKEGLHDVKRIRNGEITGREQIIHAQTKYRNGIANAIPAAYRELINQGTNNPDAHAMTLQNFATKNALILQSLADYKIHNLVLGACPRLLSQTFPRYIAHEITSVGGHDIDLVESGIMNQQDVVSIAFDALSAADEGSRDTHHNNKMDEFCRAVGKGFNRFDATAINAINIFFSGELCYSVHGVPMRLLLGTPKAEQYMFDSELIGTDGRITRRLNIVGPAIPHSQGWFEDFIKSNYDDEKKAQICARLWRFYLPLLQQLDIGTEESITAVHTQLAYNWGEKKTEEEIEAKKQSRIEMAQRKSKIWDAIKAGTAINEKQKKFLKNNFFYKKKLAWEMWHKDPSALLQNLDLLVVLVKGSPWKAHKESLLVCIDKDSRSRVALIPTLEAAASAEVERRKVEKKRIEAEREKKRLDSINKELESIEKIPDEERTAMHTIRYNLLRATLNENRPEQIHWRKEQAKEKKRLEAVKKELQREEWGKELKELESQTPSWDQEYAHQFQINLLTAQLQGRKEEVKLLKAEQVQLRKFQALEEKAEKKMKRKERERKAIEKKAEGWRKNIKTTDLKQRTVQYSYFEYSINDKVFFKSTISAVDAANAFSELDFTVSYTTIRNKAGKDGSEPSLLGGLVTVKEVSNCILDYDTGFVGTNKEEVEASKDMIRNNLPHLLANLRQGRAGKDLSQAAILAITDPEAWRKEKQINESFAPLGGRSVKSVVEDTVNAYLLAEKEELADLKDNARRGYQKYVEIGSDINRLGVAELKALVKYICKIENKGGHRQHQTKKKMKDRLEKCVPSWTNYFT